MKPHLVYRLQGATGDGTLYVTNGAAILRAAIVEGIPSPEGVQVLSEPQIAAILQTVTTTTCELAALVPSTAVGVVAFRTPDGVYLSDVTVQLLRGLGGAITLGTSGARGVVLVTRDGVLVGAVMPLAPPTPPEAPVAPSAPRWASRDAFTAIQHAGLLHWFDGGTWARHTGKLFVPAGGDPKAYFARLDALTLDEAQIGEAIEAAALEGRADFSPGGRAAAERAFMARVLAPEQAPAIRAAVEEMGAALGVPGVGAAIREPTSMASIHAALGRAFALAGKAEQVFLVGTQRPFVLIRETLATTGPFARAVPWEPELGVLAGLPFMAALARELMVRGCTAIAQDAAVAFDADGAIPAFTVRVLRRELGGRPERSVFLVTDGLRARRLPTTEEQSVQRCEVLAWADHHDDALIALVARAGRTVHRIAETGVAFYPGQSMRDAAPGWGGWERLLATEMIAPMPATGGAIDVLRITPITRAEGEEMRAAPGSAHAGQLVQRLEAADFPALLARWNQPQP